MGKMLASLGKLIGLINVFMEMVGGPQVPDLSDLAGRPLDDVIAPIDALIEAFQVALGTRCQYLDLNDVLEAYTKSVFALGSCYDPKIR